MRRGGLVAEDARIGGIFGPAMTALVYIIITVSFLFLAAKIVLHLVRGKDIVVLVRMLLGLVAVYVILWGVFFAIRVDRVVPLGVDRCYDDWCAMVTGVEYPASLGRPDRPVRPRGQFVVLYVRLSNPVRLEMRRVTQPRVVVVDAAGGEWEPSARGQRALEESSGAQAPLVNAPGLQRAFETELVFEVGGDAKRLRVLIDKDLGWWRWVLLPKGRVLVELP